MVNLFFTLLVIAIVCWAMVYPAVMTWKERDPFADHPFPRWRFLEHQVLCGAGATVTGWGLYAIFSGAIERGVGESMAAIAMLCFSGALIAWAWTRGTLVLVPNPAELPQYVKYRLGMKKR